MTAPEIQAVQIRQQYEGRIRLAAKYKSKDPKKAAQHRKSAALLLESLRALISERYRALCKEYLRRATAAGGKEFARKAEIYGLKRAVKRTAAKWGAAPSRAGNGQAVQAPPKQTRRAAVSRRDPGPAYGPLGPQGPIPSTASITEHAAGSIPSDEMRALRIAAGGRGRREPTTAEMRAIHRAAQDAALAGRELPRPLDLFDEIE